MADLFLAKSKVKEFPILIFETTCTFFKVQRWALYIEFCGVARMEKISKISLKQSVGGSESHVPCAQDTSIPIGFADGQTD